MSKQKPLINRKKRVFIDLEYIDEKDLQRSLRDLFLLISQGKEKNEEIRYYKTVELLSAFKQWYIHSYRDIKEVEEGGKILNLVKAKI